MKLLFNTCLWAAALAFNALGQPDPTETSPIHCREGVSEWGNIFCKSLVEKWNKEMEKDPSLEKLLVRARVLGEGKKIYVRISIVSPNTGNRADTTTDPVPSTLGAEAAAERCRLDILTYIDLLKLTPKSKPLGNPQIASSRPLSPQTASGFFIC